MIEPISFEDYFMLQAMIVRAKSTCHRAFVGCVLVKDNRLLATGYNGSVSKQEHCNDDNHLLVDGHCVRTIHAEQNAIIQCAKSSTSCEGATAYVSHFPCLHCTKTLIQSGISRIVYYYDYRVDQNAMDMLKKANIDIVKYDKEIDSEQVKNILELK